MSQSAATQLNDALDGILKAQRKCSWCGQVLPNNLRLIQHVSLEHVPQDQAFLDELQIEIDNAEGIELWASRHVERKIADHVDGYDRDDLGESPDY